MDAMVPLLEFLYVGHYHNRESPFYRDSLLYTWMEIIAAIVVDRV